MEFFGILSAILYNISGLLTVIKIIRQGHAKGVMATIYLLPWFGGSFTGTVYALYLKDLLLVTNFGLGVLFGGIILYYRLFRDSKA